MQNKKTVLRSAGDRFAIGNQYVASILDPALQNLLVDRKSQDSSVDGMIDAQDDFRSRQFGWKRERGIGVM